MQAVVGPDIPATPQELSSGMVEVLPVDPLLQIKADGAVKLWGTQCTGT